MLTRQYLGPSEMFIKPNIKAVGKTNIGARILLLEDSDIDAELVSHQVLKLGNGTQIDRVRSQHDFREALSQNEYDLVLSDYAMSDFTGLDALALLTMVAPDVPFIFISGVAGEKFATEAVRAGATDYVTKSDMIRIPNVAKRALDEAAVRRSREAALSALRESEERFRFMADSAPALIWSTDPKGNISFANLRFQTEYGVSTQELIQTGWSAVLHHDDLRLIQFASPEPAGFQVEVRIASNGGYRWLRCESQPRLDGNGEFLGHVGCAVDISEIRLVNESLEAEVAARTRELAEKDDALRQSQKMEALGQLTGGIAHDFNNMLVGIKTSAQLLRRRIGDGRLIETDRYVESILTSADRAAALIHRLLAFSRRQSLNIEGAEINQLISSMLELLQRTLGDTVTLKTDFAENIWWAQTDHNQFESVLLNLAINARDAMPHGGELLIATENIIVGTELAACFGIATGDYVVMRISDTGVGISPELMGKVFEPFFTTKPIGQGTGLGLSMIFGFAKQIGGHSRIESTLGEGTTVEIYMPREIIHKGPIVSKGSRMSTNQGNGTILVVEDEVLVQMLVVDFLNDLGFKTLEAQDSKGAMVFIEDQTQIDLMITDVGLPGMNGRELAEKARTIRPNLKILFATGYAEGAMSRSGFLSDGMDMVTKPFDLDDFAHKIRSMLAMEYSNGNS